MHPRRLGAVLLVLGCVHPVLATASASASAAGAGRAGPLSWSSCYSDAECATLAVPLDDAVTGGPTIDLSLVRYRARDRDERIGSLLVNPGGPGASGVDYVVGSVEALPTALRDRFDVVGFDVRGTGRSAPVDCTDDLDALYDADWAPSDDAERDALIASVQGLVTACAQQEAELLPFLTTDRAARDLDRIRAALGDDELSYLGFSYGSYLGAWYAEQFPDRVRALVLDGALDPALSGADLQVEQSAGFERALGFFLADCRRDAACAFHQGGRPGAAYDVLRAAIDAQPLAVGDRALNGTRFDLAVTQLLYTGRSSWSALADALAEAVDGDGAALLSAADDYTGRIGAGRYDDFMEAFLAIGCADGPPVGDLASMRRIEDAAAERAPRLGRSIVNNSLACALWPVAAPEPRALRARGAAPILVLSNRDDPATPFAWARALARELDSGVLVGVDGEDHVAFLSGNTCIDDLVTRYVVDLDVPDGDGDC